ncbi:MAG: thioredoxin [Methanomicrobia archaeon]|nr:thioredoxin [Methanomicrobia archaeon]
MMKAVIISAVWCPSCLIMIGRYHDLRRKYPKINFVDYDFDIDKDTIAQYKIWKTLPVMILFDGDKEVARFVGEKSLKELTATIEGLIHD